MKTALPLFALFLLLSCNAKLLWSSVMPGRDLRDRCRWSQSVPTPLTTDQDEARQTCVAYVLGVENGYKVAGGELCIPAVKAQQMVDVVYKYLQTHPDDLDLSAAVLTINAMKDAWPCK